MVLQFTSASVLSSKASIFSLKKSSLLFTPHAVLQVAQVSLSRQAEKLSRWRQLISIPHQSQPGASSSSSGIHIFLWQDLLLAALGGEKLHDGRAEGCFFPDICISFPDISKLGELARWSSFRAFRAASSGAGAGTTAGAGSGFPRGRPPPAGPCELGGLMALLEGATHWRHPGLLSVKSFSTSRGGHFPAEIRACTQRWVSKALDVDDASLWLRGPFSCHPAPGSLRDAPASLFWALLWPSPQSPSGAWLGTAQVVKASGRATLRPGGGSSGTLGAATSGSSQQAARRPQPAGTPEGRPCRAGEDKGCHTSCLERRA